MKNAQSAVAKVAQRDPHANPDHIGKRISESGRKKERGK